MNTEEIRDLYRRFVAPTYAPSVALAEGRGTVVTDCDGRRYLDFIAGIGVLSVGHCHPRVVAAVREQAGRLMHVSNLYFTEPQARLAQKLVELSFDGKCFFCNSGAEAVETLIKLARRWGNPRGRYEIISMRNSFHGRTLATLTATGQEKVQKGYDPLPAGFRYAGFNDLESCREAVTEKTAAILVEPVQGEGGVIPARVEFMQGLRQLCDEAGILLLLDEVQCGVGRTGKWFAHQHYGIIPDAMALAKGLGGGFPIGAVVMQREIADTFQPGSHASTFGGNPLACAAALATLGVIEDAGLVHNAARLGDRLHGLLESLAGRYPDLVQEVRGLGLMLALVLKRPAKPLEGLLREKGLLCLATAENALRFLPPLNVSAQEVEQAARIVEQALAEFSAEREGSSPEGHRRENEQ